MKKGKRRRANNEGTLYQRKDGRWCVQITVGYKENGKPIRKTMYGHDKNEMLIKLKQESLKLLTNDQKKFDLFKGTQFKDIYMNWLLDYKKATVSGRTFEAYLFRARNHVLTIGEMFIHDIQTIDIQRILNNLKEENFSLDTIRKVKNDFDQFFKYALDEGILNTNPVDKIKIAKSERKEYLETDYFAVPKQLRSEIISALDSDPILKPMVLTLMYAGLRSGEMLALKWKHIDFGSSTITIENAVSNNTIIDKSGNIIERKTIITNTKTDCSKRKFTIGVFLLGVLRDWYFYQQKIEEQSGLKLTDENNFVFPTRKGSLRTYSGFRSILNRFHDKHGFVGIHPHTYRHTFATMLFEENANPRTVQEFMGHRDVKTTSGIYTSINKQQLKDAIFAIDPLAQNQNS